MEYRIVTESFSCEFYGSDDKAGSHSNSKLELVPDVLATVVK